MIVAEATVISEQGFGWIDSPGIYIDAQQAGFAVCVPEDGVFDRIQLSHQATLLDLWMKYALVKPADEVCADMKTLKAKSKTTA